MANKETRHILIKVDTKGSPQLKKMSKQFGQMNKSVRSSASSLSTLKNAFAGFLGLHAVRSLARASDEFQLLRDRIKVFTGSTEKAEEVFSNLAQAAKFTKSSIGGLAESFNRIALATSDLGLSQEAIMGTTVALQQTFRLSGSTIAEATAATIQFTQGLASGQLRGQELRSVLEANAVFGKLLADQLGTTRGELIKFAESGKITSGVALKALSGGFKDLNERAGELGITINQSVTIAIDAFKLRIKELNDSIGISSAISKGIVALTNNMDMLESAIIGVATVAIPLMIKSFAAMLKSNWILIGITLIATVIIDLFINMEKRALQFERIWIKFQISFSGASSKIIATGDFIKKFFKDLWFWTKLYIVVAKDMVKEIIEGNFYLSALAKGLKLVSDGFAKLLGVGSKVVKSQFVKKTGDELKKLEDRLASINKILSKDGNKFDIDKFVKGLAGANLKEKSNTLFNMSKAMRSLNMQFSDGAIFVSEYVESVNGLKIQELNSKIKEGKISLMEYNEQMIKISGTFHAGSALSVGINNYIKSSGTLASNIAGAITQTFDRLEDTLFEFVKKGKFEFSKFTQAILDDLTKIIIRASIVQPLAGALGQAISSPTASVSKPTYLDASTSSSGGLQLASANGNAFSGGNLTAFANGGIVDSPTFFGYGSGKTGVAGEAGSEAILPLKRGSDGKLGVKADQNNVQVNIINNAPGVETQTQERQSEHGDKILDVMIVSKVKESFASGAFDKTFAAQYGLRRRGI